MPIFQSFSKLIQKPYFVLFLIVCAFLFKGILLSITLPMLKGQDETRHYVTVQYMAEPREKSWEIKEGQGESGDGFEKYVGSEELMQTVRVARLSAYQGPPHEKPVFANGYLGQNEELIQNQDWKRYVEQTKSSVIRGTKFYHKLASSAELLFAEQDIFFRFYSVRIISVLLGTLAVFLAYFLFREIGFAERYSLILTAIFSLQPMFSFYTTNINYDALLIPLFVLFAVGSAKLIKNGPDWKNLSLISFSFVVGVLTKGTAIVLAGPIFFLGAIHALKKIREGSLKRIHILSSILIGVSTIGFLFFKFGMGVFLPRAERKIGYMKFMIGNLKRLDYTSYQYWGGLDWTIFDISDYFIRSLWFLEIAALIGIAYYILSRNIPPFLPGKKHVFFLLILLIALQVGVLYNNWQITNDGKEKLLMSPGRYFIPNLAAHLALMFTGLGMLARREKYFRMILLSGLLLMFAFDFHLIFNVIIPRFYF